MSQSASKSPARRRAHYVISTHWDREWHQTFQDFRYRLVGLLDKILDRLESGDLKGPFTCDGQAIILEDYLEIRPERTEQVKQYLREGKLIAGPWYVLPDEFLVSGESIIRNIRLGREVTRSYGGKPSNAGFVCDLFGHVSQLPQIFLGFNLTGAFVWRGIEPLPDARFHWAGADGKTIPTLRFGKSGYCDYNFKVRRCMQYGSEFETEQARQDLQAFLEEEAGRTKGEGPFIMFDGGDHLSQDTAHYEILLEAVEDKDSKYEVVHSDLDTFLEEMVATFGDVTREIKGELRDAGIIPFSEDQQWLIPGVGSSRVWIKQQNARCQSLLCQWAEPFAVLANALTGVEYPTSYIQRSWTWLLQNHPHDSICGCSLDQVHEDMKYRFSQSSQIADRIAEEALSAITSNISGEVGERELRVTVFNPVPRERDEVIELTLSIPAEWPCFNEFFGFETKPAFRIYDAEGAEVPYQRLGQKVGAVRKRLRDIKFPEVNMITEVTVAVQVKLPALGYTTLMVHGDKRTDEDSKVPVFISPTRYPSARGLVLSDHELENEFLRVSVETNGSLTILDKRSGETYQRLLTFENGADIGDGWYHAPAVNDLHYTSQACAADVAITANGPSYGALRVRVTMKVPRAFDYAKSFRTDEFVDLVLDSSVVLRAGQAFVEVETKVVNTAKDHRLRVLFPSGATEATTFLADSAFDVVERPIALRDDVHTYREVEVEAKPQQFWTAVHTDQRGLAIVCDGGLLESGVRDQAERPIILTLYRSTMRTVMTAGEPEGELLGHAMSFRYRIVPLQGAPDRAALFDRAQELGGGLRTVQLEARDVRVRVTNPILPATGSLLKIDGGAVLTSLRRVNDAVEIRAFNPTEKDEASQLDVASELKATSALPVDLESLPSGDKLSLARNTLPLTLGAKQIITLALN
jgi:alpha-mannosidase/mannosylglycerate hydrolase